MLFSVIIRVLGVLSILFLARCATTLYKVFIRAEERDQAPIAWGIIFEVILIPVIATAIFLT